MPSRARLEFPVACSRSGGRGHLLELQLELMVLAKLAELVMEVGARWQRLRARRNGLRLLVLLLVLKVVAAGHGGGQTRVEQLLLVVLLGREEGRQLQHERLDGGHLLASKQLLQHVGLVAGCWRRLLRRQRWRGTADR